MFPFRELSLRWPEHEEVAQNLLDDDRLRAEFLADRYARAMAPQQRIIGSVKRASMTRGKADKSRVVFAP